MKGMPSSDFHRTTKKARADSCPFKMLCTRVMLSVSHTSKVLTSSLNYSISMKMLFMILIKSIFSDLVFIVKVDILLNMPDN